MKHLWICLFALLPFLAHAQEANEGVSAGDRMPSFNIVHDDGDNRCVYLSQRESDFGQLFRDMVSSLSKRAGRNTADTLGRSTKTTLILPY